MRNIDLFEVVKVSKRNSINILIEYRLCASESPDGGRIYSLEVATADDKAFAEDISRDRKSAEDFLYLLAREEVEPCHLLDIVYDTLPL